ncbi:hypothetical protein ACFVW2_25050 [Streptomyces sp. NPDC058171]
MHAGQALGNFTEAYHQLGFLRRHAEARGDRNPDDARENAFRVIQERLQGLPPGWVTTTSGPGRPAQLTVLGNGVVPQQAAHAVELLAPPTERGETRFYPGIPGRAKPGFLRTIGSPTPFRSAKCEGCRCPNHSPTSRCASRTTT